MGRQINAPQPGKDHFPAARPGDTRSKVKGVCIGVYASVRAKWRKSRWISVFPCLLLQAAGMLPRKVQQTDLSHDPQPSGSLAQPSARAEHYFSADVAGSVSLCN